MKIRDKDAVDSSKKYSAYTVVLMLIVLLSFFFGSIISHYLIQGWPHDIF